MQRLSNLANMASFERQTQTGMPIKLVCHLGS